MSHWAKPVFCVLLIVGGLSLAAWLWTHAGAPPRESLASASGPVARVWTGGKRGATVFFELRATPSAFVYHGKGEASARVRDALESSRGADVTVLYDASDVDGPMWDLRFHPVYDVRLPYRVVRAHADVDAGYRSDDRVGVGLGLVIAAIGVVLLFVPWRADAR